MNLGGSMSNLVLGYYILGRRSTSQFSSGNDHSLKLDHTNLLSAMGRWIPEMENRYFWLMLKKTRNNHRQSPWWMNKFWGNLSRNIFQMEPHKWSSLSTILQGSFISLCHFSKNMLLCSCKVIECKYSCIILWQWFLQKQNEEKEP
jgi:hypothetical protein